MNDITANAIDKIVEIIGVEDIALFLPMQEATGATYVQDLLKPEIKFDVTGSVAFGESGPFGTCAYFSGATDRLEQRPITSWTTGSQFGTLAAGGKLAARITGVSGILKSFQLSLKRVGSLPNAKVKVILYTDSSNVPGVVAPNYVYVAPYVLPDNTFPCATISTSTCRVSVPLQLPYRLHATEKYWVVLEYADNTGVDESNYIQWARQDTGATGEAGAIYDGTWTATADMGYVHAVYDNNIVCTGNYTIIATAKNTGTTDYQSLLSMTYRTGDALNFSYNCGAKILNINNSINNTQSARLYDTGRDWNTYIYACSKEKAGFEKFDVYLNGLKYPFATWGWGGDNLPPFSQPMVIGRSITATGGYGTAWSGYIGPIIIAKRKISDGEAVQITHLLNCVGMRGAV